MSESNVSPRWTDHRVEQIIGRLLQFGVFLAAGVTILGAAWLLFHHGTNPVRDYSEFRGGPSYLTSLGGIARGLREARAESVIQLGIVLLIATPVARVAFTLVAFILQRDRRYIVLTAIVLALLLYGLIFGRA